MKDEIKERIRLNLIRLRLEAEITQEGFAKRVKLSSRQIIEYENGGDTISSVMLEIMAKALKVKDKNEFYRPIGDYYGVQIKALKSKLWHTSRGLHVKRNKAKN